jgi:P-type conjugative transfer protein TrbG
MKLLALLTSACLLVSTAGKGAPGAQPNTVLIAAHLLSAPVTSSTRDRRRRPVFDLTHGRDAVSTRVAANREASAEPFSSRYLGGVQLYAWREGAIYRLQSAPDEVSDIALQPGETLISVAAGDTARWIISDTSSGSGSTRRAHVLVKPAASDVHTNLLIATDRRVYHVALTSGSSAGASSIEWSYPDDTLLALKSTPSAAAEPAVAAGVTVDALDFDYRIEGDNPTWRPVRAFDDGRQVFVELPASVAQNEAPPLFVIADDGKAELVNYRQRGRYYVIDRLFGAAELRLGEKHQLVVRIVHDRSNRKRSS